MLVKLRRVDGGDEIHLDPFDVAAVMVDGGYTTVYPKSEPDVKYHVDGTVDEVAQAINDARKEERTFRTIAIQ